VTQSVRAVQGFAIALGLLVSAGQSEDRSQSVEGEDLAAPVWAVPGQGRGTPALGKTTAYFLSKRHEVLAIDIQSGEVIWSAVTGEPGDQTMGSVVVLSNGALLVGDYNVVAFNARSGRMRWRFVPEEGYGPGIYLGPATRDGLAYAGSPAATMFAIEVESGRARWSTRIDSGAKVTVHQPHICREMVIAGYTRFAESNTGGIVALDRSRGTLRWRIKFPSSSAHSQTYAGGPVCFEDTAAVAGGDGTIYGLEIETGSIKWTLPRATHGDKAFDKADTQPDYRPLAHAHGRLIAGSLTGRVVAYDLKSTRQLWASESSGGTSVALRLAVDRDTVYVPHMNGLLTALDVSDGRERWRTSSKGGFSWPPAISRDRILLTSSAAGFLAFDRPRR
jgi:outer membrane protein assembly factor BamB